MNFRRQEQATGMQQPPRSFALTSTGAHSGCSACTVAG